MYTFVYISTLLIFFFLKSTHTLTSFKQINNESWSMYDKLLEMRRYLHQYPETFFEEYITSEYIQQQLTEMGVNFTSGWGKNPNDPNQTFGTGVVAQFGTGHSPCIALRADIDGLNLTEMVDLPFKSKREGYMHACGHDAHTTMLLGAAQLLKQHESELEGTVKLIFQPGEEGGGGAAMMINEGVLTQYPPIEHMYAFHIDNEAPTNLIVASWGTVGAGMDDFVITVTGKGGHAAMHHLTIDPTPAAAAIGKALNDIYARELYFQTKTAGVISITFFKTSSKISNVIPDQVKIGGTFRAFSVELMDYIRERITHTAMNIAESYRCEAKVERQQNVAFPPVHIDEDLVKDYENNIHPKEVPFLSKDLKVMGGEDFAFFAQAVPSIMMVIGTGDGAEIEGHPPTNITPHSPYFALDERAMPLGTSLHTHIALNKLKQMSENRKKSQIDNDNNEF